MRKTIRKVLTAVAIASIGSSLLFGGFSRLTVVSISDESTQRELSDRESEVLRLVARGYSNKEIAGQLSISVKTVETYKSRLSEKLDLHSRSEMVRYAMHRGWLQSM